MAYLQKQGTKWTIRFWYEGKRRRITVGRNKQYAIKLQTQLAARLLELQLGLRSLENSTLNEYLLNNNQQQKTLEIVGEGYFNSSQLAESTIQNYKKHYRHLVKFFGVKQSLKHLEIDRYVRYRRKFVSDQTIKKELITLSNLCQFAGLPKVNMPPLQTMGRKEFVEFSKAETGSCLLLNKNDVNQLRRVVREKGSVLVADAVDVIAFTGMRRSELCRLLPSDIDLVNKVLTVTETKKVHGKITHRRLPIHDDIFSLIKRRSINAPLFTHSVHSLTSGLKRAIRGTKFDKKGFGFHALRHSAASRLLADGVPVTAVASILGHATPQTTLQVYSHAFDEDVLEGIKKL